MNNFTTFLLALFLFASSVSAQSDEKAIEIADNVMTAMGGQKNWDNTRYLQWNFFGRRMWYWDKRTGDVRCEIPNGNIRIAMNINDQSGKVYAYEIEQTHPDSLNKFLTRGYRMWINDSYWLAMPFKLRDPGTSIKYLGAKSNAEDIQCEVLELTFNMVGVTPDNKYWIYVNPSTSLIVQWDYFKNYTDSESAMSTPWTGYKKYSKVLLSGGRGKRGMSDIAVYKKLPASLFSDVSNAASDVISSN